MSGAAREAEAVYSRLVTSAARKILAQALALPSKERLELVRELSDSLDSDDVALGAAWPAEISSRLEEIERGAVELVAWEVVEQRLRRHTVVGSARDAAR